MSTEPLAELIEDVERDGKPSLAWAVRYAPDGSLENLWRRCPDPRPLLWFAHVTGGRKELIRSACAIVRGVVLPIPEEERRQARALGWSEVLLLGEVSPESQLWRVLNALEAWGRGERSRQKATIPFEEVDALLSGKASATKAQIVGQSGPWRRWSSDPMSSAWRCLCVIVEWLDKPADDVSIDMFVSSGVRARTGRDPAGYNPYVDDPDLPGFVDLCLVDPVCSAALAEFADIIRARVPAPTLARVIEAYCHG